MTRTLFSDTHLTVTLDSATGIVRYRRTAQPWPSIEIVADVHRAASAALRLIPKTNLALLLDARDAPARSDPEFEAAILKHLQDFSGYFVRRAVLVKSAVGKLQAQRIQRSSRIEEAAVFGDEAEAVAHLLAASDD